MRAEAVGLHTMQTHGSARPSQCGLDSVHDPTRPPTVKDTLPSIQLQGAFAVVQLARSVAFHGTRFYSFLTPLGTPSAIWTISRAPAVIQGHLLQDTCWPSSCICQFDRSEHRRCMTDVSSIWIFACRCFEGSCPALSFLCHSSPHSMTDASHACPTGYEGLV